MSGTCACAHGMGAHLNAWPRPAACTVLLRDKDGNPRRCPCSDYRPVTRPARSRPRRVPRGRHGGRRRSPAVRLLRWLWGAR